jgi:uncharacterized protein
VAGPNAFGLGAKIRDVYASLHRLRPIEALGQKCGMDREDTIAVDLRGNVMTCQNTGAKGVHRIGHVSDFEAVALGTATHFAFRMNACHAPLFSFARRLHVS